MRAPSLRRMLPGANGRIASRRYARDRCRSRAANARLIALPDPSAIGKRRACKVALCRGRRDAVDRSPRDIGDDWFNR
jgi:hypothetical protein